MATPAARFVGSIPQNYDHGLGPHIKPGGSYVFNVWNSWDSNPFAQITHETVEGFFPEDPPAFYKVPFSYHDADEIKESLLQAGFSRVAVEHLPLKSKILSAASFAKGLVFGNPLYEDVVTRGGDPQAICAAVADAIDGQLGSEMPLQALVVHASKT